MPSKCLTLSQLNEQFAHEDDCREWLAELRWPDGVRCPRCNATSISTLKKRNQYDCDKCRHRFSVRAGTIFQDSKLQLRVWFLAVYIMIQSKKGVSANQLKRMLGVTYKTSWFLCHRIRSAMKNVDQEPLSGVVEVDETYVGGDRRGVGRGNVDNKAVVIAAVQRGGEMRARVLPNRRKPAVRKFIDENVSKDASSLFTDEAPVYKALKDTRHEYVRHEPVYEWSPDTGLKPGKREWVRGQVHTNTVEGVHSLLKRSIIGSFHHLSVKHLPAYVDEIEWKYNNRGNAYLFRDTMLELINAKPMDYRSLVSHD